MSEFRDAYGKHTTPEAEYQNGYQDGYAAGKEECADKIARLREALKDARNNGLIYWEPRTERGHVSKAQMLSRIDAALAEQ